MSSIELHPLAGADLKAVLSIWNRALVRDPISESRFVSSTLCDPDYWPGEDSGFLVAHAAGRPAGFVRAIIRRWPNDRVGVEPEDGWIPVIAVDPDYQRQGIGTTLLKAAIDYLRGHGRKRVWVCGNTGSAPGYVFPGVDQDVYAPALRMFLKAGFVVDHEPVAMSRSTLDFDVAGWSARTRAACPQAQVQTLTPERVQDFMAFLAEEFPGDWNMGARAKIRSGALHEVLIAVLDGRVVGYCQWEGEHFGPFGVARSTRNRRIGEQLFIEAVRRIREADGRTVWFNWADADAARFYARFGLTATRRFAILRKELV
ncbi:MAG TPA: GNAT family N-acetyltransferase [Phycisphaerae bacterium]|jgi:GNAT superfamily N-acetyltransferase|nr:GNAT family N-acetyltransferase [Phycisphaerae bacterium]HOB76027.1 GNAT family N-acetyltransferase [Phycisphaerae bacterium]HOJ53472.1 GNAT family N-acetyltransferase [Phycisphaerae bacterium]HOL25371.1 GNAT family N-acetyltransferase [Phycisphaerae bacterium]HPP21875.1 GNAT family N-acetyltransferase [Phycisphaerae bacterium]